MELNPSCAQAAKQHGFSIIETDMSTLIADEPRPWHAICAFQVLEHLPQPRVFLDVASTRLKPGGLLLLSVPNAKGSLKNDPGCLNLLDLPPHHMSHWDTSVFQSLENFLPLNLKCVAYEPLAAHHIHGTVLSWPHRLRNRAGRYGQKIVFNRFTTPVVEKALVLGLRRFFVRGHTLLVCFEKTR